MQLCGCTAQVVPLQGSHLLLPDQYPRFTLIGQALGSVRLGREALTKRRPEVSASTKTWVPWLQQSCICIHRLHACIWMQVFIDTTGWAFTYPLARMAGCKVQDHSCWWFPSPISFLFSFIGTSSSFFMVSRLLDAFVSWLQVACYTHYPTVSSDMIRKVRSRQADFNNDARVAGVRTHAGGQGEHPHHKACTAHSMLCLPQPS